VCIKVVAPRMNLYQEAALSFKQVCDSCVTAVFFNLFCCNRTFLKWFALLMEPYAMIQVSVLLQRHRTVVANFVPGNFGLFRRKPWRPPAEPWVSVESRSKSTALNDAVSIILSRLSWHEFTNHNMSCSLCAMAVTQVAPSWQAWQPFSACTKTCGGGSRIRKRQCLRDDGKFSIKCPGIFAEAYNCNTKRCGGTTASLFSAAPRQDPGTKDLTSGLLRFSQWLCLHETPQLALACFND